MTPGSNEYERLLGVVREVVNAWDPIGLIASGCPTDEYEAEVVDLVGLVMNNQPIDQVSVDGIWLRWFGQDTYRHAGTAESAAFTAELVRLQTPGSAGSPTASA